MVCRSDVNYFGLANLLIAQYGEDAKAEATRLMQEARQEIDAEAVADWLAVERASALLSNDSSSARH